MKQSLQSPLREPESGKELERLMVAYQQSDDGAFAELVERLSPMLKRFFFAMSVTRPYAEDLMQELRLRVHKSRNRYESGRPLLPWILTIARRTRASEYERHQRKQIWLEPLIAEFADQGSGAEALNSILDFHTMAGALPASQRDAVTMLKIAGMSLEEVAQVTGTTVGGVKQRAHRAYRRLRLIARGDKGLRSSGR